jgi:hypothetical protein
MIDFNHISQVEQFHVGCHMSYVQHGVCFNYIFSFKKQIDIPNFDFSQIKHS